MKVIREEFKNSSRYICIENVRSGTTSWIELTENVQSLQTTIDTSSDRTKIIDSYNLGNLICDRHNYEYAIALANALQAHGKALEIYLQHFSHYLCDRDALNDAIVDFNTIYKGCYLGSTDFVKELWARNGNLQRCIDVGMAVRWLDWDAIATDYGAEDYRFFRDAPGQTYVYKLS